MKTSASASRPIPLITKHTWILDRKALPVMLSTWLGCPHTFMPMYHGVIAQLCYTEGMSLLIYTLLLSFLLKQNLSLAESFILCIFLTSCIFFILNLFIYLCQYFHLLFYAIFRILL